MEGERRKRKIENEEESEEKQMEKFFALIKSTKDVHDRLYKGKGKNEEKPKGVWNPTFQPGDFIDDEEFARINISHPPAAGPSEKQKELPEAATAAAAENGNKEKANDNLDLTLSL